MKKRILSLVLVFAMVISCVPIIYAAEIVDSGQCGDNVFWELDIEGTLTISGIGNMQDYSYSNPYPYNRPSCNSPFYNNYINSIVIEDGITSIGKSAFLSCKYITSVSLPDSITNIGDYAFSGCSSLTDVIIPKSVTTIGNSAFGSCSSLTNVKISDTVTSIGEGAFYSCKNLKIITIPDSVTNIGNSAFADCFKLEEVSLPANLTSIEVGVFDNCALKSIAIPYGVTNIDDLAFCGCVHLTDVSLPNTVTRIGCSAFGNCGFTNITLPNSIRIIDEGAFCGCHNLKGITIPDGVTDINFCAFQQCFDLSYVSIPKSVNNIDDWAFLECTKLQNIDVNAENEFYCSANGILFNKDKSNLIQYYTGKANEQYTIPNGVTTISSSSFRFCTSLINITIPDSVTTINVAAFYGCDNLTDVYYKGTPEQWKKINIDSNNDTLTSAAFHYNSNGPSIKDTLYNNTAVSKNYGVTKFEYTPEGRVYYAAKDFNQAQEEYLQTIKHETNKLRKGSKTLKEKAVEIMTRDDENSKTENRYITFSGNPPRDAKIAAYEAFVEYLEAPIHEGIRMRKVDVKDPTYIMDAKLTRDILSNLKNYTKYEKYNGYTVSMNILFFGGAGTGNFTVKKGNKSYMAICVSKPEEIRKAINEFWQCLMDVTDDLVKGAASSLFSELSSITGFGEFFRIETENTLLEATKKLRKQGFGDLMKFFKKCSDGNNAIKSIIAFDNASNIQNALSNAQNIYNTISNLDYSDSAVDNFVIKQAMDKLDKAKDKLADELYNYIYHSTGTAPTQPSFFDKVKSWWSSLFQCPVDFTVYDENNDVIGYVHDGEVYYSDDIYIETSGDVKKLYVPNDMKVRIEMEGTDEGEFNYIVEEVIDGEPTGRLNYYGIELTEGAEFEQSFNGGELSADNMPIVSQNGDITADEYLSAQDMTAFVTVETEYGDNGVVIGDGDYAKGDSVELIAISSDEKYGFSGWYVNDDLVCTDSVYRFTALENVTVRAEFVRRYNADFNYTISMSEMYDDYNAYVYEDGDGEKGIVITPFVEEADQNMQIYFTSHNIDGKVLTDTASYSVTLNENGVYVLENIDFDDVASFTIDDINGNEIVSAGYDENSDSVKIATIGKYRDSAEVTATEENGIVSVEFYMLDDTINLNDITVYYAEYDENGILKGCKILDKSKTENGTKYSVNTEGNYKLMFWDKEMCPITEAITANLLN